MINLKISSFLEFFRISTNLRREMFKLIIIVGCCLINNSIQMIPVEHIAAVMSEASLLRAGYSFNSTSISASKYLEKIENNTFVNFKNLTHLRINFNPKFSDVNEKTFNGLSQLSYMELMGNSITVIRNNTFRGMGNLKFLSLRNNGLQVLEKDAFLGKFFSSCL